MLGIVVAALMAASFFMPWMAIIEEPLVPYEMLGDQISLGDLPWRGWLFLASFLLAGLGALAALVRMRAGLLMLVAGVIPYGLIAESTLNVRSQVQNLDIPLPNGGTPIDILEKMSQFMEYGLPVYFIAAAVLVVIGLARAVRGH